MAIDQTLPLCSFREASSVWLCLPSFQILISPFIPPETSFPPHIVAARAVTPLVWASLMVKRSLPDWGRKERTLPSCHPEKMLLPSLMNPRQKHSRLGTWILSSSWRVLEFQMRMSFFEQVPKTSE